jgi:UDP-N-acetylglucosamine/UDP-N-acetylgalactosamine diphosphorylase
VDIQSGRILLSDRDSLALSPDGHGGMIGALSTSGCLADAARRGIELFFYGQVDNPLLQVCDPQFLGWHLLTGSEMTTQVVMKRFPLERVGNVVEIDGRTRIIEYSDLPPEVAERRNADGSLYLWAGNIAVHAFNRTFLEREARDASALPIHRAQKRVPFVDSEGRLISPPAPNAVKFERFIFDLLPRAARAMVVEVDAAAAFAPVKNASHETVDTPETAREAMIRHDAALLRAAGIDVANQVAVEVNPLWGLDAEEIARQAPAGLRVTQPTYFAGSAESRSKMT